MVMGVTYNTRIVTDGLVLCLDAASKRSYPGTGTTWTDLKGGNNGTMRNMTSANYSSDNGGVLSFDGSNEDIIISNFSDYNSDNGTICCWAYYVTGGNKYIVSAGENGLTGQSRAIGVYSGKWWLVGYGSSSQDWLTNYPAESNKWVYVTYTWENITDIRISVNESFSSTTRSGLNTPTGSQLRIGAPAWTNLGAYGFWSGKAGLVQVYNRALTADEIRRNYLSTKERYW